MVFIKFNIANPDQQIILIQQAFGDIKEICKNLQHDWGS